MLINKIQNNIHFGYDKKLNKELKVLTSCACEKQWGKNIITINNLCNKMEDTLRNDEKRQFLSRFDNTFLNYVEGLVGLKQMLVNFVEDLFPHLHYAEREYSHYKEEYNLYGKRENDWRYPLIKSFDGLVSEEIKNKKYDSLFPDENDDIEEIIGESVCDNSSKIQTSILEEFKPLKTTPKGFDDVKGMESLKSDLKNSVVKYFENPSLEVSDKEEYGIKKPRAILFYGPPGCGKTFITQALAAETKTPLYMLNIANAGSKYINETSKNIKDAFEEAVKIAKTTEKPCLLFMDEVESMGFDRSSDTTPEQLKQIDTMLQSIDIAKDSNIIIIAATNKYNLIDEAIRSRFDKKISVDVPDFESRKALIISKLSETSKGKKLSENEEDVNKISQMLDGYSNRSICSICEAAAINALNRDRAEIQLSDYQNTINSTSEEKILSKSYEAKNSEKRIKIGFN